MNYLFWILLFIYVRNSKAFANSNIYNNNGWIPIFPDNINKYEQHENIPTSIPVADAEKIVPKVDFMEFIAPTKFEVPEQSRLLPRKSKSISIQATDDETCLEGLECAQRDEETDNIDVIVGDDVKYDGINISNLSSRKSKEMVLKTVQNKLINDFETKFHNENNVKVDKEENTELEKGSSNVYEVTENVSDIIQPVEETRPSATNTEQVSFFTPLNSPLNYTPPKLGNLTENFLAILSKYNIMVNDKLPNYVLSRRYKDHIRSPTRLMHYPSQLRIPYGYNSLNHLPVDPILAVFLSNYGHYLPGLYGIHRNYNNLYGYLASNNIHNNKPFGLYKIYSDTDSSH